MYSKNNEYKMKDISRDKVYSLGFRHNTVLSDYENSIFSYRFTAWKYNYVPILKGVISVNLENGAVDVDIYDAKGRIYPSSIQEDNANSVADEINSKIEKEFKKMNIFQENNPPLKRKAPCDIL